MLLSKLLTEHFLSRPEAAKTRFLGASVEIVAEVALLPESRSIRVSKKKKYLRGLYDLIERPPLRERDFQTLRKQGY